MALHFSANQYDKAFHPNLLQNWEVPARHRERPRAFDGFTQVIASDRGHLMSGVPRSRKSPWGTFVGTWDMPIKIPGNAMINGTARTEVAIERLRRCKTEGNIVLSGKLKKCKIPSALPVRADEMSVVKSPVLAMNTSELRMSNTSGIRSGAQNPEPQSLSVVKSPVSAVKTPTREELLSKPCTPNLTWPHPRSRARSGRAQSAAPRMTPVCRPESRQRSRPGSTIIRLPTRDLVVTPLAPSPKPLTPVATPLIHSPTQMPIVSQYLNKTPSPLLQANNNNLDMMSPAMQLQALCPSRASINWPPPNISQVV